MTKELRLRYLNKEVIFSFLSDLMLRNCPVVELSFNKGKCSFSSFVLYFAFLREFLYSAHICRSIITYLVLISILVVLLLKDIGIGFMMNYPAFFISSLFLWFSCLGTDFH